MSCTLSLIGSIYRTLQELVGPPLVEFFNTEWAFIATLDGLATSVSEMTRFHRPVLKSQNRRLVFQYSLAQRLSWAAYRETSRPEDRAYSLLGVLDINLDIRYGEGPKAFRRLQEESIERSTDDSILAWDQHQKVALYHLNEAVQLLAPSPDEFTSAQNIVTCREATQLRWMTNVGLHSTARIIEDECITKRLLPTNLGRSCSPVPCIFACQRIADHASRYVMRSRHIRCP